MNIKDGEKVIVPSLSFVATANCVLYQRAKPVFAEIDPTTYCLDPNDVQQKIDKKTKAIIPVHFAGHPADMKPLMELAEDYDLKIIEDNAHAAGALYKGNKTGSLGDVGCFSFFSNKNMTTGEGGMITTNDDEIARKVNLLKSHGMNKSQWERYQQASWKYDVVSLGFNFRMNEMQAALGISQLKKLDHMNDLRIRNAFKYTGLLKKEHIVLPNVMKNAKHVFYLYVIRLTEEVRASRDEVVEKLKQKNIYVGVHYPPIHLFSFYRNQFGYLGGELPVTEQISNRIVSLPMHQKLGDKEIGYIAKELIELLY
jgi:dTDP-4-amino-4,6-dideoxygalactose transaminase